MILSPSIPSPGEAPVLDPALRLILEKLRSVAEQHEAGSARAPLVDECNQLLHSAIGAPLGIVVLGLCERSLRVARELLDPLNSRKEIHLLTPPALDDLLQSPETISSLCAAGDILLLAGMENETPSGEQEEIIQLLSSEIPATQALVIRSEAGNPGIIPSWATLRNASATHIPPAWVTVSDNDMHEITGQMVFLTEKFSTLRSIMGSHRIARKSIAIATGLRQQTRSESESATERRRLMESSQGGTHDPGFRNLLDTLGSSLQTDLTLLTRHVDDEARDSLLPGGPLFQIIRNTTEELHHSRLTQSPQLKTMRYEAEKDLCDRLRDPLLDQLVADITRATKFLEEALSASAVLMAEKIRETTGHPIELKITPFQTTRLYNFATTIASAPLTLKAEIPRTSKGQFIWTSFQNPVMILMSLMMPMSLFLASPEIGPMLRKVRFDVALYGLIPFYIVTPFFLRHKLRKEAESALEKETERLRNTLQMDLERIARTVSDERRKATAEWLKSVSDDLRKQSATFLSEVSRTEEKRRVDDKQTQSMALQRLDARIREFNQLSQQCDQLEREARQSLSTLAGNLRAALR